MSGPNGVQVTAPAEAAGPSATMRLALQLFIAAMGGTGALQAAINNRASAHFGGVFMMGTAVSFYGGWVLLCAALLVDGLVEREPVHPRRWRCTTSRVRRCGCLAWTARPAPYHMLPGMLGAVFVTISLSVTLVIGYALFFVMTTAGFLLMSSVLDHRGLFGMRVRRVTAQRLAALAVALGGAVLAVLDRLLALRDGTGGAASEASPGVLAACLALSLLAGTLLPNQASINRSAAERLPSKLAATWWSFTCGCAVIAAALAVQLAVQPERASLVQASLGSSQWWYWMGGPLGVLYIASGIYLVRVVGSAPFFVAMTVGQLVVSAAIDATGALGAAVVPVSPARGMGIALVILAAASMQAPEVEWRRLLRRAGAAASGGAARAYACGRGSAPAAEALADKRGIVLSPSTPDAMAAERQR